MSANPDVVTLQNDKKVGHNVTQKPAPHTNTTATTTATQKNLQPEPRIDATLLEKIHKFATNVLSHMKSDHVFATPDNFEVYFAKLLEAEDSDFKGTIASLGSSSGDSVRAQTRIQMETEIRHGFVQIKNILQIISLIYKNLLVMEGIIAKHLTQSAQNSNSFELQDSIKTFNEDLLKLNSLMTRHINAIKTSYDEIGKIFKNISAQSVYDPQYGIFNKRYFIEIMKNNLQAVKKYGYNEVLMLIQIDPKVLVNIDSTNDKRGILRHIAQTLFNISRRSDLVAHYENGCFCILMPHTDIQGAKMACERIRKLISQAKFFVSETELKLELQIVIAALKANLSAEEIISNALDGLEKSSGKSYEIVGQ